jgi:hypothetical protein
MVNDTTPPTPLAGWKRLVAPLFAAVGGMVGSVLVPSPERAMFEEAAAHAGRLTGSGLMLGVVAAGIAHWLVLRGQSRSLKVWTYLAGGLTGAICANLLHG